jgi:HEAT repeat protein
MCRTARLCQVKGSISEWLRGVDLSDIGRIIDFLGPEQAIAELKSFSTQVPAAVQREIAVALLRHGQLDSEGQAISPLMDRSAPTWKRQNAAFALGDHGTLRAVASVPTEF